MVYQTAGLRWRLFLTVCLGAGLAWHFQDSLLPIVRRFGDWIKSPQDVRSVIPGAALVALLAMWVPWIWRYRASFPKKGEGAGGKPDSTFDWLTIRTVFKKWLGVAAWICPALAILVALVWLWSLARNEPNTITLPAGSAIYAEIVEANRFKMKLVDNVGKVWLEDVPLVDRGFYRTLHVGVQDGILRATPGLFLATIIISVLGSAIGVIVSYFYFSAWIERARIPLRCF